MGKHTKNVVSLPQFRSPKWPNQIRMQNQTHLLSHCYCVSWVTVPASEWCASSERSTENKCECFWSVLHGDGFEALKFPGFFSIIEKPSSFGKEISSSHHWKGLGWRIVFFLYLGLTDSGTEQWRQVGRVPQAFQWERAGKNRGRRRKIVWVLSTCCMPGNVLSTGTQHMQQRTKL